MDNCKALLVDDEYLELELLSDNVAWAELGFEICGTAKNGREATELIPVLKPDVVITDIKMPIMDGIALSQWIYSHHPDIIIVFLSGYNQFEYLKNAFKVDAVDYLIKPLDLDEIPPILTKIREKCAEKKQALGENSAAAQKLLHDLMSGASSCVEPLKQLIRKHYCSEHEELCRLYALFVMTDEYDYLCECGPTEMQHIQSIRQAVAVKAQHEHCLSSQLTPDCFVLVSPTPIAPGIILNESTAMWKSEINVTQPVLPEQLPQIYTAVLRQYEHALDHNGPGISEEFPAAVAAEQPPRQGSKPEFNLLIQSIQSADKAKALQWTDDYYECAAAEGPQSCFKFTVELLDVLYSVFLFPSSTLAQKFTGKSEMLKRLLKIRSTALLKETVNGLIQAITDRYDTLECAPNSSIIDSVCGYIDSNCGEPLSVDSLAQRFNFSPNYLSTLFKKQTGQTVLEYITDVRMKRAVYLLQETPMRVVQISQKIGYRNPSYFCTVFSKKYGITPNMFRSKLVK